MRRLCGTLLLVLLCAISPARALDSELALSQLKHSSWTTEVGAPARISALAQDRDGFIWIGGGDGLYRFDGVIFEKIPTPDTEAIQRSVTALLVAHDGTIWIGYTDGHLETYRNGIVRNVSTPLIFAYVMRLVQTSDGTIWAALGGLKTPMVRFAKGKWHALDSSWGFPSHQAIDAKATRDGSLFVTTSHEVVVLRRSSRRFEHVADVTGSTAVSEDHRNRIWVSDNHGSRIIGFVDQAHRADVPTPHARRGFRSLFDKDDNLWGVNSAGIFRVRSLGAPTLRPSKPQVEQFLASEGLTSNTTRAILEDREGNIWVGTTRGLDVFRNASVVVEPDLMNVPRYGIILLGAADGSVFAGTADGVYRIKPGGKPEPLLRRVSESRAICEGPTGTVWILLEDRFFELRSGTIISHPFPLGEIDVQNCVVDHRNKLWVNGQSAGLFRWDAGEWTHFSIRGAPVGSGADRASFLINDNNRKLVMFLGSDELVRSDDEARVQDVVFHEPSLVSTIYQGRNGLYFGGLFGLGRVRGKNVQILSASRTNWLRDISNMIETPDGQIWLTTKGGIIVVDTARLERAFSDSSSPLKPIVLNFADGLPDVFSSNANSIGAARGGDGRLWFGTTAGAVWVDPKRLQNDSKPPTMAIRALASDQSRYLDAKQLSLPAGVSKVTIDYSGFSISSPERLRFRYRLDGVDDSWIEAGSRREAFYTNLSTGAYVFHVIAASADGPWSTSDATVSFTIAPTFVQSIWFKILIALAFASLAWLAYAVRIRRTTTLLQSRFDVRIAERERIARELHDTLLQGCQGLLLGFQSIANRFPIGHETRTAMEDALGRADAVLAEGRARVRELRGSGTSGNLTRCLVDAASNIIGTDAPRFDLTIEGTARALNTLVDQEVLRVFEEAVRNVVKHAHANTLDTTLTYGRRSLRLSIRDDGLGMEQGKLAGGDKSSHFGLVGMRERAERIGGQLEITSRERVGTEVVLIVPASAAYDARRGRPSDLAIGDA